MGKTDLVLTLIFLTFLNLEGIKPEQFSLYGEPCDTGLKCEQNALLKCKEGVCKCARPDTMTFVNSTKKCHVKSGERCSAKVDGKQVSSNLECVPNSLCASDGYCTCELHFVEDDKGVCAPKGHFHASCHSSKQCRDDIRLECIKGRCLCNRKRYLTYSWNEEKCVTMAGFKPSDTSDQSCVPNASYNYGKCKCNFGYNETVDGLCVAPYGEQCYAYGKMCGRDMLCKNGKCECYFSGQVYENGKCYSKAGQPCIIETREIHILDKFWKLKNQSFPCVINSECKSRSDNENIFECQCNYGYIAVNGNCRLDHLRWCGGSNTMQNKCDESRNMECINGQCRCPVDKLQYFDDTMETCRGLVGAPCEEKAKYYAKFCTDGASCVNSNRFKAGPSSTQVCACMNGYRLTDHRKCVGVTEKGTTILMQATTESTTTEPAEETTTENFALENVENGTTLSSIRDDSISPK